MTLEQLTQLQDMLKNARNTPRALAAVMGYFTDHLGDELDVLKQAQSTINPFVTKELQKYVDALFPNPEVADLILASLPSCHFYYGPFRVAGLYGLVIYFGEELGKGLISTPAPDNPDEEQKYKVFTS
jgi:hypothetical protein